jgi:hypothetical protein
LKASPYFACFLLIGLLVLASGNSDAQDLLEKKISFKVVNEPLDKVLEKISNLGDFSFSYSPDVVDVRSNVTYQASNQSIREILTDLFKGKVTFKERRKYIILQKNIAPEENKIPENFQLNGYIIDNRTGEKLANASIYESVTLASTVSNQYGYYRIKLPTAPATIRLEVRKEEYIGRSIPVVSRKDTYLPIKLTPDTIKTLTVLSPRATERIDRPAPKLEVPKAPAPVVVAIVEDTSSTLATARQYDKFKKTYQKVQSELISAFATARQAINTKNITDTLHRPFQASILPFLGTNHGLSGNIVNDVSINFIAGYSKGVNQFEIGAVANVVRENVKGFQLAGVSNIVGKDVTGFQYANIVNITLGNVHGFQGSNFINYTQGDFRGVQVAGVGNVIAANLDGWQLSTGYNYARTVRSGRQIGLINYADSTATVPFGMFSYVRQNGYRRYEFANNELNYFNFAFKTGVRRFYNIFALGFSGMADDKPLASVGYGFGTAQNLGRGWAINADLTGNVLFLKDQQIDEIPGVVLRFATSIEKKLGNRFALFAGPSLNIFTSSYTGILSAEGKGIRPIWIDGKPDGQKKGYGWVGFQVGMRFCNRI